MPLLSTLLLLSPTGYLQVNLCSRAVVLQHATAVYAILTSVLRVRPTVDSCQLLLLSRRLDFSRGLRLR